MSTSVTPVQATAIMTTQQVDRCRRLMLTLTLNQPVLGLASVRTILKPGLSAVSTAGIDVAGTIYVGEAFFKTLDDPEARFVLAHELMHLLLYHFNRRGDREAKRWNRAADRWINAFLRDHCSAGGAIKAPGCALFPLAAGQEKLTVEQLYDLEPESPPCKGKKGKGKGQGQGDPNGGGGDDGDGDDDQPLPTAGCGPEGAPHPKGEGMDPAPSPGDAAVHAATWRRVAETAKALAREAGSAAGDALANALSPPPPRVKWSTLIKRACEDAEALAGDDDVSWQRRSRRSRRDVYLPGSVTTTINVAVVIDSSGSVPDASLAQAISETIAIAKETHTGVYLVVHDAIVQFEGWVETAPQIAAAMKGRGGTRFKPAYDAVAAMRKRFGVMVHLTDACPCEEWPTKPANVTRGIVALIGYASPSTPSWAHTIPVDI